MSTRNLESIKIHQFRGLRELELENLGLINLLVGINNSGKTSVLEALNIYCHPLGLKVWLNTARQREQGISLLTRTPTIDALRWLFPHTFNFENGQSKKGNILISSKGLFPIKRMEVSCEQMEEIWIPERSRQRFSRDESEINDEEWASETEEASGIRKGLELNIDLYTEKLSSSGDLPFLTEKFQLWEGKFLPRVARENYPNLPTAIVTSSSHQSEVSQIRLLSEARFNNFKFDVINLLQQLDRNIADLEILSSSNDRLNIYVQHNKLGLTPISTFGDGVRRLLDIALKLASVRGGILLIDEIESAIHTEALQNSFGWLVKWCKGMDVQLFGTTHSLETVDALVKVTESSSDLVFYRLEPREMYTRVVRHEWNRLKRLREELGQEVRW